MPLGPTPRKIRRRPEYKTIATGCVRLFILPHMIAGAGFLVVFLLKVVLGLAGPRVEGRVEEKFTTRGSKGSTSHHVRFSFVTDGGLVVGKSQISAANYSALPEHGSLPVVYLPVLPQYTADYMPEGDRFPANTWAIGGFGLFWNGLLSVFVYLLYIAPWRRKWLVKNGEETTGRVVSKGTRRGSKGGTFYDVHYSYLVMGQSFQGKESVPKSVYEATTEGGPVDVVFDPAKPKRSVAVTLSEWEVVIMNGRENPLL